jgi:hypothetical protein
MAPRVADITGILESGVAEDFSSVQVSFAVEQGKPLICRIRRDTLQHIIIHFSEMAAHIRSETLTTGEAYSVPAIVSIDAKAYSSLNGEVIVTIKAGNKVAHHFALAPEIAARLRSDLEASADASRWQND